MKKLTSYGILTGLKQPSEHAFFLNQVADYGNFICKETKKLASLPKGNHARADAALALCRTGFSKFGLRCWLLETIAGRFHQTEIAFEDCLSFFKGIGALIQKMASPQNDDMDDFFKRGVDWLMDENPAFPVRLVVVQVEKWACNCDPENQIQWIQAYSSRPALSLKVNTCEKTPAAPELSVPIVKDQEMELGVSQKMGLKHLEFFYSLKMSAQSCLGINPRPIPLIVGPSGCGKTALARYFSKKNNLPILELNSGSYLVTGSRSEAPTHRVILQFVRNHTSGTIFIDELDKFSASSDWCRSVQQEVYALLDSRMSGFEDWTPVDMEKIKKFFFIGAATFQDGFKESQKRLGFNDQSVKPDVQEILDHQTMIPEELLFRLNQKVIHLEPMSPNELKKRITELREKLGLKELNQNELEELSHEAWRSRKNVRWLEAYLSDILYQEYEKTGKIDWVNGKGAPFNAAHPEDQAEF